ncbi:KAP family P-loop NTPase fold protein [Algoriphagus vanfongensis]|uniref:KAP family P-loop NTPase fold protein n=1 Tax=Algoriphagus vanfongensis TaxID=426371 RepID=UPI0004152BD0|nr:P-loop NTPase fold protein [Algoriphagus vanfongensis]
MAKSLRTQKIRTSAGDPFEFCELGRKRYAEILTSIIETYSDGFVLALNNKWGEGKTTFIEMWRLYLGQSERAFQTLYFNAWEHDFNHDPLSAILSELKSLKIYDKQEFAPLIKKGAKLTRSLIPVFLNAVAEKYVDTKILKDAFQKLSEEAASIFEEEVNEYANKKKGLEDFKKELETYVSKIEKKPLIFFIDELDRCNPKYAVELLEIVKHFFSVPGIVFVLSIDKSNLINSVKGYFGSSEMDGNEYLRRFIDLEYSLPTPILDDYIHYMFQKSGINDFLKAENRRLDQNLSKENDTFYNLAYAFFNDSEVNLRQIEKILFHCSIILKTYSIRHYTIPKALFIILFIKFIEPNFYRLIKNSQLNYQEFLDQLYDFISPKIKKGKDVNFGDIESLLLVLYNNNIANKELNIWETIENDEGIEEKLIVTPRLYSKKSSYDKEFAYFVKKNNEEVNKGDKISLDYFISRIEIMHDLKRE